MSLSFPNPSRSFDASRSRVCFWGYDSTIEITFFVETDVIKRLCPETGGTETELLQAFDAVLERIHAAADKIYVQCGNGSCAYVLAAEDFQDHHARQRLR